MKTLEIWQLRRSRIHIHTRCRWKSVWHRAVVWWWFGCTHSDVGLRSIQPHLTSFTVSNCDPQSMHARKCWICPGICLKNCYLCSLTNIYSWTKHTALTLFNTWLAFGNGSVIPQPLQTRWQNCICDIAAHESTDYYSSFWKCFLVIVLFIGFLCNVYLD